MPFSQRLSLVFAMDWRAWLTQFPFFAALWAVALWLHPHPAISSKEELIAMLYWFLPLNAVVGCIGAAVTGAMAPRALRAYGLPAPQLTWRVVGIVALLHVGWTAAAFVVSHSTMGVAIYFLAKTVQSLPVNSVAYWGLAVVVFVLYGAIPLVTYGLRAHWLAPRVARKLALERSRQHAG